MESKKQSDLPGIICGNRQKIRTMCFDDRLPLLLLFLDDWQTS
jgi:hypothetical protein